MRTSVLLLSAVVLVFAAAHLGLSCLPVPAAPPGGQPAPRAARPAAPAEEPRDPAEHRRGVSRSQEFHSYTEQVVGRMAQRVLGLEEACDHILQYCLAKHPAYLTHVAETEQGTTFRARLARAVFRLIAFTDAVDDGIQVPAQVLVELVTELEAILLVEDYRAAN